MHNQLPKHWTKNRQITETKLVKQIQEGESLFQECNTYPQHIEDLLEQYNSWNSFTAKLLGTLFPSQEEECQFRQRVLIQVQRISSYVQPYTPPELDNCINDLKSGISILKRLVRELELYEEYNQNLSHLSKKEKDHDKKKIFIVHGHDDFLRHEITSFLLGYGLSPIVLHEKSNSGQFIIEKIEKNSDVCFAIVLLTPDDEGRNTLSISDDQLKPRARQNVILELGYFMGKLGRQNVCAVLKQDIEKPSDCNGLLYLPYDSHGGWKLNLLRELKAAGIEITESEIM
jgi:predicted nucleotide-binding protein